MRTKYFEIYGHCQRDLNFFMQDVDAVDRNIQPMWQQFFCAEPIPPESTYVAFGYTAITRKHLNRLADFYELKLIFVTPALKDCDEH